MKFKIFGFQVNTLYIILLTIVILAVLYFGLGGSLTEGFGSTSMNIVVSLLGDDYDTLPTTEQIDKAIGVNYDVRFKDAVKNAVTALYKMTIGLPIMMKKGASLYEMNKKGAGVQEMKKAITKPMQELRNKAGSCFSNVAKMEKSLSGCIDALTKTKEDECGETLFNSTGFSSFETEYAEFKKCKDAVMPILNNAAVLKNVDGYQEFHDFFVQYVGDITLYLDKFSGDMKTAGACKEKEADAAPAPAPTPVPAPAKASAASMDNYNHFTKSSLPSLFYGPNGAVAKVGNNNGKYSIIVTNDDGENVVYTDNVQKTDITTISGPESAVYYGPQRTRAVFYTDSNGYKAIKVVNVDGSENTYTEVNKEAFTNRSETDTNAKEESAPENTDDMVGKQTPSDYGEVYSMSLTSDTYDSSLPKGIPKYMIPPGQEDMYILKSEIVPPVCPACPPPVLKCDQDASKPPPPCPPCARCPEPAFDCKKVPNYGTGNLGANYNNFGGGFGKTMSPDGSVPTLPFPVSNDYSTFGM